MGYTHYWRRPRLLKAAPFAIFVTDVEGIVNTLTSQELKLAGPNGKNTPIVSRNYIGLNGAAACGHQENTDIVLPWPAQDAGGVAQDGQNAIEGSWFAGAQLSTRICNGNCSYETFEIRRLLKPEPWQGVDGEDRYGDFCKTAFRPYDLAVIAILIAFKQHFGDVVRVSSDGTDQQWFDGKLLCKTLFGYGFDFEINEESELVSITTQRKTNACNQRTS